jgi:hypothetical protein
MGFGGTAKKLQRMIDMAEQTYNRINEVREQLNALRTTVEETGDRVEALEAEQREQRALLEALADERGLDVNEVLADPPQAEPNGTGESNEAGETNGPDGTDENGASDERPAATDNNS